MAERRDDVTAGASPPGGALRVERVADGGSAGADAAEPTAIRADIRETRERLGDTLEEIGDRLNPRHLTAQVKDNIRDATIGRVEHMARSAADRVSETRHSMMDTIRDNPIPAAMVGIGLGWLLMNGRRDRSHDRPRQGDARYASAGAGPYWPEEYAGYPYGSEGASAGAGEPGRMERVRERVGEAGQDVRDRAADMAGRTQHVVGEAAHQVQDAAGEVAERAQQVASTVATQTRYQARRMEDHFYEQPLAMGAVTLALGMAAGLALPTTDREVQLMGDARDRVVDRVRDVAGETREKVGAVAERVVDDAQTVAKQAARDEGLTSSSA